MSGVGRPNSGRGLAAKFKELSISGRINALIAFAIVCQLATVTYQLKNYRDGIWEQRRHELANLTAVALSIVSSEHAATVAGKKSVQDAQTHAMQRLRALRYNSSDYFWINDMTPKMVMHPIRPELDGQDLTANKDPNGKRLFVEFVETVRQHGKGFVDYKWPKPGADLPQSKLSYVVGFEPWQWVIGTGVYVDDLETLFASELKTEGTIVAALIALCAIVSLSIGRGLSRSVVVMSESMERLATGDLDAPTRRRTGAREIVRMADALHIFRENALEKQSLEHQAHLGCNPKRAQSGCPIFWLRHPEVG
jgi:methyl-accepting chemotaxis protein